MWKYCWFPILLLFGGFMGSVGASPAPIGFNDNTLNNAAQNITDDTVQNTTVGPAQNTSIGTAEDITGNTAENITGNTTQNTAVGPAQNTTVGAAQTTPGEEEQVSTTDNSQETTKDLSQSVGDDLPSLSVWRLSRIFCNYNVLSAGRKGSAKYSLGDTEGKYCTDFNLDSAELEEYHMTSVSKVSVLPHKKTLFLPSYTALNNLKVYLPDLRTFLTIRESASITFSSLVLNSVRRNNFVTSSVNNLRLWGFNGMIVKWLYPQNATHLTKLLVDLRNAFDLDYKKQKGRFVKFLLGVMVSGQSGVADKRYEVYAMSRLVDFIVLQLFDEQPRFDATTRITSSIYNMMNLYQDPNEAETSAEEIINTQEQSVRRSLSNDSSNNSTISMSNSSVKPEKNSRDVVKYFILMETIKQWTTLGADKSKLIVALSLTGQGYILKNASQNGIGAPVIGPSAPGASTVSGEILFYEMCRLSKTGTVMRVSEHDLTPYWYNETQWVSYEDMQSLTQKVEYLKNTHILGMMLVSQSEDDFDGLYCDLGPFPASKRVYNGSKVYLSDLVPSGQDQWISYCRSVPLTAKSAVWLVIMAMTIFYLFTI